MHGRTDNVKTVYPLQTKFAGGIKNFIQNSVCVLTNIGIKWNFHSVAWVMPQGGTGGAGGQNI